MEKDVAIGKVAGVHLDIEKGKAEITLSASETMLDGAVKLKASMTGEIGADQLADMLFAIIEKKSPPGVVMIEETVKMIVKNAIMAL